MDHRTHGETRNCKGCRYWSEMIAGNIHNNGGEIEAMCLSPISPARGKYMGPQRTCAEWASGHLGAVDEVWSDPLRYEQEKRVVSAKLSPRAAWPFPGDVERDA